jgi:hypothetical protein
MMTVDDLKAMVDYIESLGDFVEKPHRDSFARAVITLVNTVNPEKLDFALSQVALAGATISYLEARWRAKMRKAQTLVESVRASTATKFREASKLTGAKITEGAVSENIDADPNVLKAEDTASSTEEITDIIEGVRYALKEHQENLRELSRNERQTARLGS